MPDGTYTNEQFVRAVREHSPTGTSEVGEAVGCSRVTAEKYLKRLNATGDVEKKKIANVLVWSIPEDNNNE